MADIQLTFGAEETISTELDKATKATDKLTKSLGAEEKAAAGAEKETDKWKETITAANQALEIAGKVWAVAARSAAAFAGYVKDGALEAMAAAAAGAPRDPVFSDAEWHAIRTMCDGVVPRQSSEVYMTPSLRVQPMPSN